MHAFSALIIAAEGSQLPVMETALEEAGLRVTFCHSTEDLNGAVARQVPDVVVLEWRAVPPDRVEELLDQCRAAPAAVLAVLEPSDLTTYDFARGGEDFLVTPITPQELVTRTRQLLWRAGRYDSRNTIRRGELVINQDRYEVTLGGRAIFLTFKEYQLLTLLASNPGRVYTREGLLSQVWGYDYFGGTRTVDVHIRRLRSKIEDAGHTFIETVRNVGYRFRPEE